MVRNYPQLFAWKPSIFLTLMAGQTLAFCSLALLECQVLVGMRACRECRRSWQAAALAKRK